MLLVEKIAPVDESLGKFGAIGNGLAIIRDSFGKLFHGAADIAAIVIIYSIHGFGRNSQVYELQAFGVFLRPNRVMARAL